MAGLSQPSRQEDPGSGMRGHGQRVSPGERPVAVPGLRDISIIREGSLMPNPAFPAPDSLSESRGCEGIYLSPHPIVPWIQSPGAATPKHPRRNHPQALEHPFLKHPGNSNLHIPAMSYSLNIQRKLICIALGRNCPGRPSRQEKVLSR